VKVLINRLFEGIKSAKVKYVETGKLSMNIFNTLVDLDPTPQKKYIEWMSKAYVNGQKDIDKFEIISDFDQLVSRNKIRGDQSDINKYKTTEDVYDVVKHYEAEPSKTEQEKEIKTTGADKVFENDKIRIYLIKSKEASCIYGSGTKWCTSAKSSHNYFHTYYYDDYVNLYYILKKKTAGNNLDKIAVAVTDKGKIEVYDSADKKLTKREYSKVFKDLGIPFQVKEDKELVPSEEPKKPEILGKGRESQYKLLMQILIQYLGLSDDEATDIIYKSERPEAEAELKKAVFKMLTTEFGLKPTEANNIINQHEDMDADDLVNMAKVLHTRKNNRLGNGNISGLLKNTEEDKYVEDKD